MNSVIFIERRKNMKNAKTMKILLSFALLFNISLANIMLVFAQPDGGPLSSLSVDDAALSPSLSEEQREYTVALPEGTTQFNVQATPTDENAKVTGTGKYDVDSSEETVKVKVKEGSKTTTYTINVKITNTPILTIPYEDQELGFTIAKANASVIPEGFNLVTSTYQGSDIRAYKNESLPIELVYLQNDQGTSDWYCLIDGKITGRFNSFVFNKKKYYAIGVTEEQKNQSGYVYGAYDILNTTVYGWKVDDDQFKSSYMLYLMDESGTPNYYVYDIQEKSLTDRRVFESNQDKSKQGMPTVLVVALGVVIVGAISFAVIIISANKKREQAKVRPNNKVNPSNVKVEPGTALVHTQKIEIYPKQEVVSDKQSVHEKLTRAKAEKEKKRLALIEKKRQQEEIARQKLELEKEEKRRQQIEEQKRLALQKEAKRQQEIEKQKQLELKQREEERKRREELITTKTIEKKSNITDSPKLASQMHENDYEEDPMTEILAYIDNLFYHE